jgi:hypothetical protein
MPPALPYSPLDRDPREDGLSMGRDVGIPEVPSALLMREVLAGDGAGVELGGGLFQ